MTDQHLPIEAEVVPPDDPKQIQALVVRKAPGAVGILIKMRKPNARKPLGKIARVAIVNKQRGKCFYCGLPFGWLFVHRATMKCVTLGWDHLLPHSYCFNSSVQNVVASCYQCNSIKGSRVFDTVQQAIHYVRQKRINKGLPVS